MKASPALRLGLIGAVAALLLAVINAITEPVIEDQRRQNMHQALASLAGDGSIGEQEISSDLGILHRWSIEPNRGWILELQGNGYGGPMTIMASYTPDGEVIKAKLLDNNETVGFGKKAEEEGYMDIFIGTGEGTPIPLTKTDLGGKADVVAGATVTFIGISEAIALGSETVKTWN